MMSKCIAVWALCGGLLSVATAEPNLLSSLAVNNSYSNVHSVYVNGYYLMVNVHGARENSPQTFSYSVGLYKLINNTVLENQSPGGDYGIRTTNGEIRLTAEAPDDPRLPSWMVAVATVCSSAECAELYVGRVADKTRVYISSLINWCSSDILGNDQLLSFTNDRGYRVAIVARESNELLGFICLPTSGLKSVKLVCANESGSSIDIRSVKSTITEDVLNVFILLSNGSVTSMCSFSQTISTLPSGLTTINSASFLSFSYEPVALAVSAASEGHIAFVSSGVGRVSKLVLMDVKQTCEQYVDLCSCRAPKDPKCGWCVSSSKCTNDAKCEGIFIKADPSSDNICWSASATPSSVSRDHLEPLEITVHDDMGESRFVPSSNAYRCMFGSTAIQTTAAGVSDQTLTCRAPEPSSLKAGSVTLPVVVFSLVHNDYLPLVVHYQLVVSSNITKG